MPRVLAGRGVYEDCCYTISDPDGFALKAVNRDGQCVDWAIVRNATEYEREMARLWLVLDERDPADDDGQRAIADAIRRRAPSACGPRGLTLVRGA